MKPFPSIIQSIGISVLLIVLVVVGVSIIGALGYNFATDTTAMLILHVMTAGTVAVIFTRLKNKEEQRQIINLRLPDWKVITLVVLATLSTVASIAVPVTNLIPMSDEIRDYFNRVAMLTGPSIVILMGVSAPIFEELIFRGIILDGMLRRYGPVTSIVLSSILFGLVHLNPWQFVTAFLVGLLVGWAYFRTQSLLLCMIVHASVNLIAYVVRQLLPATAAEPATWTYVINAGVLVVSLILLYHKFTRSVSVEWRVRKAD